MRFVIITGLSGAGKSHVVRLLEDIGFYCVDNLPPMLLSTFAEICEKSEKMTQVALVMDARGGALFQALDENIEQLKQKGYPFELLFLEAQDEVLIRRYKESRRTHPLDANASMSEAIAMERKALEKVKKQATYIIDTSHLEPKQLDAQLMNLFASGDHQGKLNISVVSFGFKHGILLDADMVFDVRFLPNPFYIPELKEQTGLQSEVRDYVMQFPQSEIFLTQIKEMLMSLLGYFTEEGKSQLVIGIGCTGGKHRSVAFAQALGDYLLAQEERVVVRHRDIERGK